MPVDNLDYVYQDLTVSNFRINKTFKCTDINGNIMSFAGYSATMKAYEVDGKTEVFSLTSVAGEITFSGQRMTLTKTLDPAIVKPRKYRYVLELQGPEDSVYYERIKGKIKIEQNL
jgi:hypothetical protein